MIFRIGNTGAHVPKALEQGGEAAAGNRISLAPGPPITVPRYTQRKRLMNKRLVRLLVPLLLALAGSAGQAASPPSPIRVVLDDNYPPYIFRDSAGQAQGILKDLWDLWQQRTGIPVDFRPMDWGKARAVMESGQADVIDTIFETEERRKIYDFSPPYATIEVPIFFDKSIGGITDAASLAGFTVGVKDGDACIDFLAARGITNVKRYTNYEAEVKAAIGREIRVLCIDKPPAFYFFNRENAADRFRYSPPLYVGEFHWAVARGESDLRQLVEDGFARISAAERTAIETRWLGEKLSGSLWPGVARYGGFAALAVALMIALLFAWNWSLRRRVAAHTAELASANSALRESEARFRSLSEMSSDFFWESDAEHRLTARGSADKKSSSISAFQRGAQIGERRWDIPYLSPDAAGWQAHRAVLDAHQSFRNFELSRRGSDGSERFISVSGDPVFDASGAFTGYRGVGTDISERKRAADTLRAAEGQFRGLVEQSVAGVYIVQDGKFAYVNPRTAEIIGQGPVERLIGCDPLQWIAAAERGRVAQNLRRLLEGETQSVTMDFAAVRGDGTTIQIGGNAARATHNGRPAVIGMMQDISEKRRAEEQIQLYLKQLETAFMSTVEVATSLSEMRDPYTAGHERRVGKIAAAIGTELGFDAQRIEGLRVAGYLHDIGKITIPTEILSKPGKLSPIEYQLIQAHPRAGYDVLKDVEFPWPVAQVALEHHERLDGSGYPQGLKGDAILLEARILAVADVIEAMSSHRPYRPGLGIDTALAEIERGRGSAYDADVADACLRLFREHGYQVPD